MTALARTQPRMTADEFWAFDRGGQIGNIELVHGHLRMQSYPSGGHGVIQLNIGSRIKEHLSVKRLGCRAGTVAGVIPTFDPTHNVRVPDVTVTFTPHSKGERAFPSPVLIVQVLSPSNQKDTWESIQACSTIGTVMEILVVDSEPFDVQVFRRGGNGLWPDEPERVAAGGIVRLTSIELEMLVDEIYASVQL